MKTVSEFKRTIAVGQLWHAFNHPMNRDMGIRKVSRVQSNSFAFETPRGESWCDFPKARDYQYVDDNTCNILEDGQLVLTYRRQL